MLAVDVMMTRIVAVGPDASVEDVARTMLDHRISAAPVIEDDGTAIEMVSEGDLMRHPKSQTARTAAWWLTLVSSPEERASTYICVLLAQVRAALWAQ